MMSMAEPREENKPMMTPLMAEFDGFDAMICGGCATARQWERLKMDGHKTTERKGTRSSEVIGFKGAAPKRRLASPPQRMNSPVR